MTEFEAVVEAIQDENALINMTEIMNEMAAMVILNQALNNALWIASDKLGKANDARDKAIAHLKHSGLDWMHEVINIMELMTAPGTHRDKDEARLAAIAAMARLIKDIQWGIRKASGIAREEIAGTSEYSEIPF